MRLIRGNVERVAESQEQIDRLKRGRLQRTEQHAAAEGRAGRESTGRDDGGRAARTGKGARNRRNCWAE